MTEHSNPGDRAESGLEDLEAETVEDLDAEEETEVVRGGRDGGTMFCDIT